MEITDKTITLVGVVSAAAVSVVALAIGNNEMAVLGLGIVGTAIGVPVATSKLSTSSTKQTPTQATEDTSSDLSTEDLVKEVDANTSLNDTGSSSILPEAVNKVEDEVATATGLSDDQIAQITNDVTAKVIASIQAQSQAATRTVVTQ